jgi:hypothetical protein
MVDFPLFFTKTPNKLPICIQFVLLVPVFVIELGAVGCKYACYTSCSLNILYTPLIIQVKK